MLTFRTILHACRPGLSRNTMADDVGEMRVMKSKKSVNFGGAFHQAVEEPHAAASASVQRSGISRRDKGTSSLAGLLVGGEGGGGVAQSTASMSAAKKARKRRRMWRRIMQRFSPAYWLHVLDKKLPILHPEATGRVAWDFFMLALVVYVCFMEPYNIAFGYFPLDLTPILPDPPAGPAAPPDAPMPPPFAPTAPPMPAFLPNAQDDAWEKARLGLEDWNWAIDAFFWMDLLSNFRTAYVDATATLIRSGAEIAKHYLHTWFPIDLLACIPFTEVRWALWSRASGADSFPRMKRAASLLLMHFPEIGYFGQSAPTSCSCPDAPTPCLR